MAKSYKSIKAGWSNPNKEVDKKKSYKDIKASDYNYGIDESYIKSFLDNSAKYFSNATKDSAEVNYGNASSHYSTKQSDWSALNDKAQTIRAYYNANKGKLDSESYKNMMDYLDGFDKDSSKILGYYRNKADLYSKFETEAEYNDAIKIGELYDMPSVDIEKQMGFSSETYESDLAPLKAEYDKLNKDIQFYGRGDKSRFASAKDYNDAKIRRDELKKQMTDLQGKNGVAYTTSGGQNITWENLYNKKKAEEDFNALYGELSSAEDWEEFVQKGAGIINPTQAEAEGWATIGGGVWGGNDNDGTHLGGKSIGNIVTYSRDNAAGIQLGGAGMVGDHKYRHMTEEEVNVYNYYLAKYGEEKANDYLRGLDSTLMAREDSQMIEGLRAYTEEHPVIASGLSVWQNLGAGGEFIKDTANYIATGEMDSNSLAKASSTIRGTVSEKYDWEVGEWDAFDFLYGTGMSMIDSKVATTMFGGGGGFALGLSAAAQGTNDALDRGMSKGQAFMSGLASGIFEGIFESWSIGEMKGLKENLKRADFRNLAKYVGKNMWNNAKEETLTEIANIAYDTLFNGDFSQYETAIRQYMASGLSETDAKLQVAKELGVQVAEAAGSGALMGFGFGVGGGMKARSDIAQSGKAIKDAGETRNLVDLGKSLGEGTDSYKYANKITDKSRALAIGNLLGIVAEDVPNANKSDMIKAFEEKGYNTREATLLVNKMFEEGLDSVSNIRGMTTPSQTYNDVLNDPNSTVSQRNEAYNRIVNSANTNEALRQLAKAVKNKSAIDSQKALTEEQGKLSPQEDKPLESKFESNTEGKDYNVANEKVIASKKLVSSEKDNMKFEVTYDDGTTDTVDANDINFSNEGEALVYSTVMDMNVPVGIAEQLISGFNGNDVNSAATYVNGMREAFVFGKYNQEADLHSGAYATQLTEEQRSNAFKLGGIYAKEKAIADEKAIRGETKPSDIKKQDGKVHFEGDKLSLKSVQDVSLKSLDVLGKALGKDIHIFESYVDKNGNRVYKDANGNIKKAPNGFYRQLDGSIWIDLNAGSIGQGTMMYTVAHELTHFIKQWSPTKFKALADFLVEQYGKEGVSVADLVREQQAKAKRHHPDQEMSYDVAFEEMVADSMETMLTDGKVIRELAPKDKGLFDKIKAWIDNLLRKLKKEYEHYSPETKEGQMLREMKKTFEEAQRLFADALVDASENFAIKGTDVGFIKQNMITQTGKLAGVMDSTRTETEPMPKMVMDMSSGNGGKLFTDLATNYLIKGIGKGGAVNGYTVAQIREAIMKANGYNTKEIRNVQAFMKSMADFMNEAGVKYRFIGLKDVEDAKLHYSYNADGSIKSVVLSAMVKNGDYPVNFDFSSICKKRVAMSKLINKLCDMGAMDKGTVNLSPKNIFEINKALKDEGFETACLGCFVESKRYNIQEWANSFIKKWNEAVLKVNPNATYFGFTDGKTNFDNLTSNQVFAIDKAAQTFLNKTGQERRDKAKAVYNEKAKKGEALLEKLPKTAIAKIKKSQTLDDSMKDYFLSTDPKAFTLADVNLLIDNEIVAGKSISNKQKITKMVESGEQFQHLLRPSDLLTERGITQLEQLPNFHGILYGHYGSGTPKLVQGFTPYNSEIALLSEKKGDKTLAEYLYSIAGVRMQSFSDFQIQNIFDYLQMIADLSARKLPAHAYTKEISFAKLLGMTGIKTNLSVMFDIDTSVDDAHAGLTKYNSAIHQGEYAKIVLEDEQGKWVYNIGDYATQKAYEDYEKMMGNEPTKRFLQSIGFADAVKLQTTEGYTKNCGIIGVGYSDAHILAMLDDSRIRYIIPYHSSSLPHEIKVATNIEKGTDYTSTQNTMKIVRVTDKNGKVVDWSIKEAFKRLNNGKAVIEELNKHIKEDGWVVETKKAQNGHGTYDLYGDLSNTSDPRMTADNFMSWCAKNGSLPLFYQFADHNNYYKMLYDFNVYDNVTEEYAPQGAVTNTYPTGANVGADVVSGEFNDAFFKETVENYMQIQNDFNARLDGTIDKLADKIVNNTMPDADFGILNSDRDSEGKTLSAEQIEFFKDSQVRWGENLMPVYHGTRREFTVFDATKGYDENRVGGLIWAAKDYEYAKDYSYSDEPIVMKGYLNITNLLDIGDIDNYADYNKRLQEIADLLKLTPSELEAMATYDDSVKYIYDITSSKAFRDRIIELGYDGVEAQESGLQTFGFVDSNQFKNIDNTNPTSNPDIRYSSRIEVDMSEEERYEVLKDKKIQPQEIEIDKDFDIEFSFLENNIKSVVEKTLVPKLRELGYLKKYKTTVVDVDFEFTGRGTSKSLHSQENYYGGNLGDFAKVVLNMQKLLDNSVLLEIHTDKGKGTPRENSRLVQTYVLLSAFRDGNAIKPVQFEVKQYIDNNNRLYLAVALTKIETGVKGNTAPQNEERTYLLPVSDISLADLFKKVNIKDAKLLKYAPNQFLNEEQIKAKEKELEEDRKKYSIKESIRVTNTDSVSTRSLLANALEGAAQNDIEKNKLAQYKEKIALIEAEQNKLHELREKLFTKGIKGDERRKIQDEATRTANRITTYDRQLFNLESTTALKNVLNREKTLAMKKQKQRDAENLKAYKERRDAEVDYLIKKNKKAIESRHKTVLKHKISDVLFKLDRLLNRGNKKRNIKQGLQQTVGSAINLGRMLFNSNIENEDIIRFGISALTEKEKVDVAQYQRLLAKKDAFYMELDELQGKNMEGADFDRYDYIMLELDKINKQMRSLDKKLADVFERERARLNETEVTELVEKLAHDFAMLKESKDEYIKNSFDEYKYNRLLTLAKALKGTTVKDMSKAQLQETYDAFKMIEHAVKTANDLFFEGQKADLMEYVENVQSEVKDVADEKKDRNAFVDKTLGELNKFTWENLRPVDAFARLGSKTFEKLFWNAIEGFSKAGRMVAEAGDFIEAVRKKYGYSKWDLEVAPKTFITTDGKEFKPSLADMMSIYAYSFREQAMPHMTEGGFTYDTGRTYKDKTNDDGKGKKGQTKVHKMSDPYILSEADINNIVSTLSDEQRAYVKECLPYFQVLATEGNKVSMLLHGIEIFKDKAYFPLKSSYDYLSSTAEVLNNAPTMASLQNIGMTKETTPGANNPIVLRGFDDVLSSHIEDMASYCSLALPITNLRKVFDNVGKTDADKPTSTKALISSRFGAEAKEYFEQWIIDLNGGIKGKGASGLFDKLFSRAKGVSVAANMSVIVQQYFAITRAMEIIDPKYFSPTNKEVSAKDMKEYEELCKYSGIAIIKEIGGYDVGAKGRVKDYINDRQAHKDLKYIRKKTDDVLMWGASAMDKLGWTTIWKAVKKEVAANGGYTVGSEEFLNACAKRFEEVVTKTQVYDSVASRSGYMRSQNVAVKYATSFMSEPTVQVGRQFIRGIELVRAIKRKDKSAIKQAGSMFVRAALTISVSQVLGKLAQSLIYASRDDDEDEAFLEKWLSAFVENLHYDLKYLGLNNLPFVRDIISVIDGFSTDRPDMTLIEDVVNAIRKGATDGCTFDEATNLVGAIGNIFGIPVKNIVREFKSIGSFVDDVFVDDIAPTNLSGAIAEGFSGEDYSKGEKLFSVYESGDAQRVKDTVADWVKEKVDSGKTEKEAKQSVKSSFTGVYRDAYKKAYKNKDAEEMNRIRKFLYATGLWNSLTELDSLLAKWRTED